MANAATIAAVGLVRQLPERAVVVALATAFQESELKNLDYGDRDSVGLFQQRPSQGWGTPEQILDPRYSAGKFYSSLVKVRNWEGLRVTEAAQRVQRSAFPEAYEKWADESTVLAEALTGRAGSAVTCTQVGEPQQRGLSATEALGNGLRADWGDHVTVQNQDAARTRGDRGRQRQPGRLALRPLDRRPFHVQRRGAGALPQPRVERPTARAGVRSTASAAGSSPRCSKPDAGTLPGPLTPTEPVPEPRRRTPSIKGQCR